MRKRVTSDKVQQKKGLNFIKQLVKAGYTDDAIVDYVDASYSGSFKLSENDIEKATKLFRKQLPKEHKRDYNFVVNDISGLFDDFSDKEIRDRIKFLTGTKDEKEVTKIFKDAEREYEGSSGEGLSLVLGKLSKKGANIKKILKGSHDIDYNQN